MPSWGGAAKGATTGAAVGSFVPVIGTGVGAGIGGLIGGLFGGGDKKDEASGGDGDVSGGVNYDSITRQISERAGKKSARADALGAEADESMALVTDYFRKLAGGDAAAVAQATQPQRARVIDQYDTARNAIANFGPRGGGSTSASAMSRISQANQISDITAGAQADGADKLANIGMAQEGLALSAEQLASADMNTLISAVLNREGLDAQKSAGKGQMAAGLAQGLGTLLGLFLTRSKAA